MDICHVCPPFIESKVSFCVTPRVRVPRASHHYIGFCLATGRFTIFLFYKSQYYLISATGGLKHSIPIVVQEPLLLCVLLCEFQASVELFLSLQRKDCCIKVSPQRSPRSIPCWPHPMFSDDFRQQGACPRQVFQLLVATLGSNCPSCHPSYKLRALSIAICRDISATLVHLRSTQQSLNEIILIIQYINFYITQIKYNNCRFLAITY